MKSDAFRSAAEAMDLDATIAQMSADVVLRSPVVTEPFHGKEALRKVFAVLYRVFEELEFIGSYASADGSSEILHFRWRIGDEEAEGVDMVRFDAEGLIDDYRVMVRPLSALLKMQEAVWSQLPAK
jgi:ketosteroid isomerase-like protein